MGLFGNLLGDLPVIGHLIDTDAEKAAQAQTAAARDAAEAYAAYRPEYQQNQQAALANLAGLLGPLNAMVQQNTGQSLDLGAGLAPAVGQEALAIGPQPSGAAGLAPTGQPYVGVPLAEQPIDPGAILPGQKWAGTNQRPPPVDLKRGE